MTKGWFITFEGGEGAGKTLQAKMIKDYLELKGFDVVLTREPGGTELAEKIRQILIGPDVKDMDGITEVFLYAAARREHFKDVIRPALEAGKIVISDRFFDTSIVYQGFVKKAMPWHEVLQINLKATNGAQPDLTLFFDIDPKVGLERIKQNSEREVNRFDKADMDFHYDAYYSYQALRLAFPARIKTVNADQTPGNVYFECLDIIEEKLGLKKKEELKLTTMYLNDKSSNVMAQPSHLIINPSGTEEPLLFLGNDGVIKWNGKVVTKDEELVSALRDLLTHTR